jgi:ELWxxDGT repeat protein
MELWVEDENGNASVAADIYTGTLSSRPGDYFVFQGKLHFSAEHASYGRELFYYDVGGGAQITYDLNPTGSANPEQFTEYNGKIYFVSANFIYSYEGEGDVPSLTPHNAGDEMIVFGGELLMAKSWGIEAYAGTNFYLKIDPWSGGNEYPRNLTVYDGRLFFTADDGTNGRELWVWDGFTATMVDNIDGGAGDSITGELVVLAPTTDREPITFELAATAIGGSVTRAIVLADLDEDVDLDLVEGNDGFPTRVWKNDGHGSFSVFQDLGTRSVGGLAVGNINPVTDDYVDIVQGNYGERNLVWANDGTGTFTTIGWFGWQLSGDYVDTAVVTLGDIDEDGDLDVVEGNRTGFTDPNRAYRNDGFGGLTSTGQVFGPTLPSYLGLADMDGDFDLDLLRGGISLPYDGLLYNDGFGSFSTGPEFLPWSVTPAMAWGDLDRDGDLDVAQGDQGGGGARIWMNDGAGRFGTVGPVQLVGTEDNVALAFGDMDRDGDLDLVVANWNQLARVYLNDGTGSFIDTGIALTGSDGEVTSLALGDVDRDSDMDIVIGYQSGPNGIWLNSLK